MNLKNKNKSFHPKDFEKQRYLKDIKLLSPIADEKVQQYAFVVFTVVALSVFGLFAISPTITTILELRKKLEDSELVNQQLAQKLTNLSSLQQAYANLGTDLETVNKAIPTHPDVARLIGQLQTIATEENVSIQELQSFPAPIYEPKKKKGKDKYPSFEFSVEVTGTYNNLQSFLKQLTAFERIVTVTSVGVEKDSSQEEILEMTIKGKAYYKNES